MDGRKEGRKGGVREGGKEGRRREGGREEWERWVLKQKYCCHL